MLFVVPQRSKTHQTINFPLEKSFSITSRDKIPLIRQQQQVDKKKLVLVITTLLVFTGEPGGKSTSGSCPNLTDESGRASTSPGTLTLLSGESGGMSKSPGTISRANW